MLSKIIKLEDIKDDFSTAKNSIEGNYEIEQFMRFTIKLIKIIFSEQEKLKAKVKRLEQQQSYYPFSEEELMKEPVGGTD